MKAKILSTRHAEIPQGATGKADVAVTFIRKFTKPGAQATEKEEARTYSFEWSEVELLPEEGDKTPTVAPRSHENPSRHAPPITRKAINHKFDISGFKGFLNIGFDAEDKPIEIFVTWSKSGSTLGGVTNCFARAISLLLQYGVPLNEVVRKFEWHKFEPLGPTSHPQIGATTSVVDYIARFLGYTFIKDYQPATPQ
jgi:hypothetical protein